MKRIFTLMLALLMLTLPALAEETDTPPQDGDRPAMDGRDAGQKPEGGERPAIDGQGGPGGRGGNGGNGGMASAEPDEELLAILAQVQDKYQLLSYTDEASGITLQYYLYTPEGCQEDAEYPLIMFIPDSRAAGRDPETSLTIGWGSVVWATPEEQAKHPCFVLIPIFTETVVDDNFNTSDQIDVAMNIIHHLTQNYSIDESRLYTTGQSMGGMTSFHLNVKYPDLFAASLFVGSQWDNSILDVLEGDTFFYIVSAGDEKASTGQSGLMAVFDRDGVGYSHGEWSAKDDAQTQAEAVQALIDQGYSANFVTFTAGTTLPEGMSGSEHLTSFDYAYRLETVRDWLFAQSK